MYKNFNIFALPLKFVEKFLNYEITLDKAIKDQNKLEKLIIRLENYNAKNKKIEEKNKVLKSAVKLFCVREDIIGFYRKGVFPFKGNVFKTKEEEYKTTDSKEKSEIVEETKNTWSNLKDQIKEMSKEEIKNEKPNDIFGIANEIIDFNKEIQK